MADLFSASPAAVPLERQIKAVERELAMRRRVYPSWVARSRMSEANADEEIAAMEAVLATLKSAGAVRCALAQIDTCRAGAVVYLSVIRGPAEFWSVQCPSEMAPLALDWKAERDAALAGSP